VWEHAGDLAYQKATCWQSGSEANKKLFDETNPMLQCVAAIRMMANFVSKLRLPLITLFPARIMTKSCQEGPL
jgi:hypothetical protein